MMEKHNFSVALLTCSRKIKRENRLNRCAKSKTIFFRNFIFEKLRIELSNRINQKRIHPPLNQSIFGSKGIALLHVIRNL